MKRRFLITLLMFLALWGIEMFAVDTISSNSSNDQQIEKLDQQIQELEAMKRGYEARALRHEDQADRLQFDDQTYLEMRRHNQLAAENRAKAAAIQKEINRLKEQRNKSLSSH